MGGWLSGTCFVVLAALAVGCAPEATTGAERRGGPTPAEEAELISDGADDDDDAKPAPADDGDDAKAMPPPATVEAKPNRAVPTTPPPASAPAAGDVVWTGRLTKTTPVTFGGGNYCKYTVTLNDVLVRVTTDAAGNLKSSTVTTRMTEATGKACPYKPIAANTQVYTGMAATPDKTTPLAHMPDAKNKPRADLVLTPAAGADTMPVQLAWHRSDIGPPFDWRIKGAVTLTKQAATP